MPLALRLSEGLGVSVATGIARYETRSILLLLLCLAVALFL